MGVQGNGKLASDLQELGIQAVTVGDADRSGTIAHAVHDAYDKLSSIQPDRSADVNQPAAI